MLACKAVLNLIGFPLCCCRHLATVPQTWLPAPTSHYWLAALLPRGALLQYHLALMVVIVVMMVMIAGMIVMTMHPMVFLCSLHRHGQLV